MPRGPVPNRSDQRRRRNKPDIPLTAGNARPAPMPEPDDDWHPLARDWFISLGRSGQSDFYQDSDWQTARVWAEFLSRALTSERISAQMISAWATGATSLLATEGDRRRMRLELARAAEPSGTDEVEDELDAHRRRAGKSSGDAARGTA